MEPAAPKPRSVSALLGAWLGLVADAARARPALFAAFVAALAYLPFLTAGPIRGALEGNRLEAAREMLSTGDWVIPRLHGEPYLAKPPGHPWAMAALSLPLGGMTLWSGRLVSVLSVVLLAAWLARFASRALGPAAAAPAACVLLACGVLIEKGSIAELEAPLVLFASGAMFALHDALRAGRDALRTGRDAWRPAVVAGLSLGAAILIKGPVAPIPLTLAGAALIALGPRRGRSVGILAGVLALGFAAALPWLGFAVDRLGYDTFVEVWRKEVVQRLPDAGPTNNEPFWYYAKALPAALGPVALLLPAALVGVRELWRRERAAAVFLLAWGVLTILAFSFSSGKEVRYLLPTLPAWAALTGFGVVERARAPRLAAYLRVLGRATAGALVALPLVLGVGGWIAFPAGRWYAAGGAALLAAGLVAALASGAASRSAPRALRSLGALALMVLGLRACVTAYLLQRSAPLPLLAIGELAADELGAGAPGDAPIVFAGRYASSVHFALARPLLLAEDEAALPAAIDALPDGAPRLVMSRTITLSPAVVAGWELLGEWDREDKPVRLYRLPPR